MREALPSNGPECQPNVTGAGTFSPLFLGRDEPSLTASPRPMIGAGSSVSVDRRRPDDLECEERQSPLRSVRPNWAIGRGPSACRDIRRDHAPDSWYT